MSEETDLEKDDEDEKVALELSTPPEPTDLRVELQETFRDELEKEEKQRRGSRMDNSITIPTAIAETTTEKIEEYLWQHWADSLANEINREAFKELATLPQSNAVRWVNEEVSWQFYVDSLTRKIDQRDEVLK